jgi:TonB family protein
MVVETWKQWEGETIFNRDDESIRFQLGQYLGSSSSGPVFLTDLETQPQKAAIKLWITHPSTHDTQILRWHRATKLSHPHLLRLFHTGACRMASTEVLFAVMEFAEEDLSQILPERALTPQETLEMLKPALEALGYLHSQGFVHGHLKPANIVAVKDQLKLATDRPYVAGDEISGQHRSPYDPPEMQDGGKAASPGMDVWSLGMTLTEILTQQRPSWNATDHDDPILPQELPQPFQEIVRNCLRRIPHERWTIDQIAAHLQPAAPIPSKSAPVSQHTAPAKKTSKRWLYVVPSATAVFAAILVAGLGILHRQQVLPVQAQTQPREETPVISSKPASASDEAQKPSPATPLADSSNNQPAPKIVEASLPTAPATEEVKTPTATVQQSAGVVQQVLPNVPQKARETITGRVKVKVRVQVDASGKVTEAELDAPSTSKYFAGLALQAAQQWKFIPTQSGADDEREWLLRFEFGQEDTKVFPSLATRKAQ